MATHAMYDKIDSVCKNFIRVGVPYYAVCDTKNEILWKNETEKDIDAASEMLRDDLNGIREYNTAIFTIKHYSSLPKGGIKKNLEADVISTFKRATPEDVRENAYYRNSEIARELANLKEIVAGLKTEQEQIGNDDEDIENDMEPVNPILGVLHGVVSNPSFQSQIGNFIVNMLANLTTHTMTKPTATSLAGDKTTETLNDIIQRLFSKGVTAEDLQKLSNKTEQELSFLLNMLRAQ